MISFVPLPSPSDVIKTNDVAVVSGWGRLRVSFHFRTDTPFTPTGTRVYLNASRFRAFLYYISLTRRVHLQQGGPTTVNLQRVNILIADQEYCKHIYNKAHYNVYDTQVCAYDPKVEKGSCNVSHTLILILSIFLRLIKTFPRFHVIQFIVLFSERSIFSQNYHGRSVRATLLVL